MMSKIIDWREAHPKSMERVWKYQQCICCFVDEREKCTSLISNSCQVFTPNADLYTGYNKFFELG